MNPRKMIYIGVLVIGASILTPSLFGLWAFYNAFQAMRTAETAGIGAVGGVFEVAVFGGLFMIIGILTGTILIFVGNYKNKRQSISPN